MKKIYKFPHMKVILLEKDVVRCSVGTPGDDAVFDNEDLPILN